MIRSTKFWIVMAVFQVAFGLAVFAMTRHYYLSDSNPVSTHPGVSNQAELGWPERDPESDLEQLISQFPAQPIVNDPAAMAIQADDYFANQQYGQAAALYEQVLAAGSQSADIYNNLGITLHYLGRSSEALRVLNEGVVVDPAYQRIWLTLGYVNSQLGHVEQARTALTTAVELGANTEVGQSATEMLRGLE